MKSSSAYEPALARGVGEMPSPTLTVAMIKSRWKKHLHIAGRSDNFPSAIASNISRVRPIGRAQTAPIQFQSDRLSSIASSGLA
jgi:hypothetical protein